ncbi:CubicO group peptidase (beta-lactamase class C family) [Sinorhizobium fredii]|uniref:serine hydrolase domain-containing protein n=1 Tax=Rhizobium fredii TaxID=380 RepID=UPI003513E4AA
MKHIKFLIGAALLLIGLLSQAVAEEPKKSLRIAPSGNPSPLQDNGPRLKKFDVWCSLNERCDIKRYVQKMGVCGLYVIKKRTVRVELYNADDICDEGKNGIDKGYSVASVAKSFTSTLLGQRLAENYRIGTRSEFEAVLQRTVGSFLKLTDRLALAEGYSQVKLDDLLLMRSGTPWREADWPALLSDSVAFDNQVRIPPRKKSLIEFASRYRLARHHDADFNYSALDAAMPIAVAASLTTGHPLLKEFEKGIWGMIGAAHSANWNVDISGDPIGSCCFQARIDDLARFGDFVLHKGRGSIPAAWFDLATAPLPKRFEGLEQESAKQDASCNLGYGYFWWLRKDRSDYFAYGRNGKFVHIYPEENVVIVQMSDWHAVPVGNDARCIALKTHDAIVNRLRR